MIGSLAVGAAYGLVMTGLRLAPGDANFLWVLGIPLAVGFLLAPRVPGITLSLPLAVAGLFWTAVARTVLGIPIFAM